MSEPLYKIGDKFGRWIIMGNPIWQNSQFYYPVKCECGRTAKKAQSLLKNEWTSGCSPCYLRQRHIERKAKSTNI